MKILMGPTLKEQTSQGRNYMVPTFPLIGYQIGPRPPEA